MLKQLASPFGIFAAGILAGICVPMLSVPVPKEKADCSLYKVSSKVVTSYVLKPPPAEPLKCPVAQVTKCPEIVSSPNLTNANETQDRPRKRKRIRRYWR